MLSILKQSEALVLGFVKQVSKLMVPSDIILLLVTYIGLNDVIDFAHCDLEIFVETVLNEENLPYQVITRNDNDEIIYGKQHLVQIL